MDDDQYPPEEAEKRARALARWLMSRPHTPHKAEPRRPRKKVAGSFADGWRDGWKSVCGEREAVAPIPSIALPSGADPYTYGYQQGRAVAGGK